jgi:hypothetical protein
MKTPAQSESANVPADWRTFAEQTDYRKTPRYAETVAYARKLDEGVGFNPVSIVRRERRGQRFAAFNRVERQNFYRRGRREKKAKRSF